ncbi:unnamed protein product [Paramecium pentaurelia]|uniref:Homeobox domain-containing protein n=1 Tax=Paramecium pentaurelia TaxID=43138 RepID=A0A8S1WWE2_9CILI|nr:unnamed protein product [Paramecium pentaurelia]
MSQSLTIHQELRKQFVLQQVSNLESQLTKWVSHNCPNEDILQSHSDEAHSQSQTHINVIHFQGLLMYLKSLSENPSQLEFHTLKSLQQYFDYMSQILQNELKLSYQRQTMKISDKTIEKKSQKFSKKSNLILKNWLNKHYFYPYPSKEQVEQLAEKCNLTQKQIQIWFINARGRIGNKMYEEKKFKNIVKSKYLSLNSNKASKEKLEINQIDS